MGKKDKLTIKKIKYRLEEFVSRGFWAQTALLAGVALLLTLIFGVVAVGLGKESYAEGYWDSLMHMIDQGTITADERDSDNYYLFMLFVTFVGMGFTGTIIGIITTAFHGRLDDLKKGHSEIVEDNHIVILGFDGNAYAISQEISEGAFINGERVCIAVADELSKEDMEHMASELTYELQFNERTIQDYYDKKNADLLFRSGKLTSENTFAICAVARARTIIINQEDDMETIRILIALVDYLKKNNAYLTSETMPNIVAQIHEKDNVSAAMEAAEIVFSDGKAESAGNQYKVQIIYAGDIIDELFVQSFIEPSLPFVYDALLNYRGSSVYIENDTDIPKEGGASPLLGKSFWELGQMTSRQLPLGFMKENAGKNFPLRFYPPEGFRYEEEDRLIYLSHKRGIELNERKPVQPVGIRLSPDRMPEQETRNFLFIGSESHFSEVLSDVNEYCPEGSSAIRIVPETEPEFLPEGISMEYSEIRCANPYCWNDVRRILEGNESWFDSRDDRHLTNIVILNMQDIDASDADDEVMVLLLNLRQYLDNRKNTSISITAEIQLEPNQKLLQKHNRNDVFVAIGVINRMIAQIADDTRNRYLIDELLGGRGAAIELHSPSHYVDVSQPFNFACVFRSAVEGTATGQNPVIPLGWIRQEQEPSGTGAKEDDCPELVMNPSKEELEKIYPGGSYDNYRLIVLSVNQAYNGAYSKDNR